MSYSTFIHPKCKREIDKACKKNPVLEDFLKRKIAEILENPSRYKLLRHDLAGERRVHVLKSFVLKFEIDESRKIVNFLAFEHHDEAYRR